MLMEEFARPYKAPNKFEVLRFRYTTYFGEKHPAAKKVVMNFNFVQFRKAVEEDPKFDDLWAHKLKLLLGTRYNPNTDEVRMSCELYPYPAQNKRWLSDKLDELMEAAAVCPFPPSGTNSRLESRMLIFLLTRAMPRGTEYTKFPLNG
jgi:small subunit ribosomal protein S35